MKKVLDKYGMCPSLFSYMKTLVGKLKSIVKSDPRSCFLMAKRFRRSFLIGMLLACAAPLAVYAQSSEIQSGTVKIGDSNQGKQMSHPLTPQARVNSMLQDFKEKCFPVPENMAESFSAETYLEALDIAYKNRANPCEASVALKLLFEGSTGQWTSERIKNELWDTASRAAIGTAIGSLIFKKLTPPVLALAVKAGDLWAKEVKANQINAAYREALNLFTSTKQASREQLDDIEIQLKKQLADFEDEISDIRVNVWRQLGDLPKIPLDRYNPATAWILYFQKEEQLEKEAVYKMRGVYDKIFAAKVKLDSLRQRRNIADLKCDFLTKEYEKNCKGKTTENQSQSASSQTQSSQKPFDKKNKEDLYWCLCKCSITIGVWGGYYPDPVPNSSPSCEKAGMCARGNWGCSRFYPVTEGSCFDSCVKSAGVNSQDVIAEINKIKLKDFNDLIKEARGIIEEYISKIVPPIYRKKTLLDKGGSYTLFAQNISDNVIDGQALYAAAPAADVPMTYIEMIKEKNRRGDPDKALSLVKAAESILPDRKGELQNVLAEFAIIMSKASLNIVTDLEFDEGLYLLRKAAEFYKVGEASPLGENIKRLIKGFEKWKKDWQVLQQEIPNCLSLINKKQVCGCDKLYQAQIYPAAASLMIYEFASSEKWTIGTATGSPRAIPEKDKIFDEIKNKLASAKSQCEMNPILKTKEMKDLIDYETRKTLEQSPYINQDDLKKYSAPVICDTRAVKYAEKTLSTPDLCDCQQNKIKGILDMAKKYAEPIEADFKSDAKEITFGQHVRLDFRIKGGKAPFMYEMSGDYPYNNKSEARGFTIQFQPKSSGANTFYATVVDSCGDSESKKVSVYVKPTPLSKTPEAPPPPATAKTAPPIQPPTTTRTQNPGYDPTKDPSYTTGKKPIDVAEADNLGKGFQEAAIKTKKPEGQQVAQQPLTPVQEPTTKDPGSKKTTDSDTTYPPSPPYPPATGMTGTDWTKWGTGAPKPPTSSQSTTQPTTQPHTQSTGQPPTQPTTQPPATGGSTTTTPVDTRTVDCSATTKSGADAPATITVKVGQTKGTANFYYDMYTVKDRMIVQYAGQTLLDTGCISGSKTVPLNLSGASDSVTVIVQPACEKKGTQWNFKLECPQPAAR